jgi:hypothetical protein
MRRLGALAAVGLSLVLGCSSVRPPTAGPVRAFDFRRDTFSFVNELYWVYDVDPDSGETTHRPREGVENGQRCVTMARGVRQFFYGAVFDPQQPHVSDEAYRSLIEQVLDTDPRQTHPSPNPVTIPGYSDLRAFSRDHAAALQEGLGGRWRGYAQRGNWRMIYPFAPRQHRATAAELASDLAMGHPPIVHIVNFPRITINHTVVLFDVESGPTEIRFHAYDPNDSEQPGLLVFDRATATFRFSSTDYFSGGTVKAYEIYDGLFF